MNTLWNFSAHGKTNSVKDRVCCKFILISNEFKLFNHFIPEHPFFNESVSEKQILFSSHLIVIFDLSDPMYSRTNGTKNCSSNSTRTELGFVPDFGSF